MMFYKIFTNITNFMWSTTNGIREGLVKKVINIAKIISVGLLGGIFGGISVAWVGYSLLTLTNAMEEEGSYDYMMEGESMRIFGLFGILIYLLVFGGIAIILKKKKIAIPFLVAMLLSASCLLLYIFV